MAEQARRENRDLVEMKKRNKYIFLTIVCIFIIILIQTFNLPHSPLKKPINLIPDEKTLYSSPYAPLFVVFVLLYFSLLVIGFANLVCFIGRKLFKKRIIDLQGEIKEFPLSEEKTSKLFFLIFSFVLLMYVIETSVSASLFPLSSTPTAFPHFAILLNLTLEIIVIVTVIKFLKTKFLGLHMKKTHLMPLSRIYTAMLPLIICALLLNNFLIEKIGADSSLNPAIELLLSLKSKPSLFLLSLQVMFIGPIAEELFFRGVIYKLLRTKYAFSLSASLASVIFASIHGTTQDLLPLFTISMALCYIYEKTQNIFAPILIHSIHNSLNIGILTILKILNHS